MVTASPAVHTTLTVYVPDAPGCSGAEAAPDPTEAPSTVIPAWFGAAFAVGVTCKLLDHGIEPVSVYTVVPGGEKKKGRGNGGGYKISWSTRVRWKKRKWQKIHTL